ncbi:MAG: hypothetical protein M3R09_06415 [Actinomycetota bacterium]|nr:hypothetical protein [Actinomycetota bacterium]
MDTIAARLHTNWTRRSDGPIGSGDEGTSFVVAKSGTVLSPAVSDGKLVCDLTSDAGAVYCNQQLPSKVKRIGAVFGFGPGAAGSAIVLCAWTDVTMQLNGAFYVPDTHCHFTISATAMNFDVWQGGTMTNLVNGALPVALVQDYRPYRVEVSFDNDTATFTLPNGLVQKVTDSRIASINGAAAGWEYYQPVAADAPMVFYQTWADSFETVPGDVNEKRTAEIAVATVPPPTTASTFGVAGTFYPFPTASAVIDAAVAVTGKRGPTGSVLIDVEAFVIMTNASNYIWEIFIDGAYSTGIIVLTQPFTGFLKKRFVITGLSAGNHSFQLRHWQTTAAANNGVQVITGEGKLILMSATPI